MIQTGFIVRGDKEIAWMLMTLPQRAAQDLQNVVAANAVDHKKEVVNASAFKTLKRGQVHHLIRAIPKRKRIVARLQDVVAGTASYWQGLYANTPREGAAARIEKKIGPSVNRPKRGRYLLIPQGDMLTAATGRVRKIGVGGRKQRTDVRGILGESLSQNRRSGHKFQNILDIMGVKRENTRFIRMRGRLWLVELLPAGKWGAGEAKAAKERETGVKVSIRRRGLRSRILGLLVPQAKQPRPLDFFGSWERLAGKRQDRYRRMLAKLVTQRRKAG